MSVPAHLSGLTRAKSAADVDAKPGGRPQSRKLHTSPPLVGQNVSKLFDLDHLCRSGPNFMALL